MAPQASIFLGFPLGALAFARNRPRQEIARSDSEMGAYNAAESGESLAECIALDIHRVRQRLAVQIWRDYQDHLTARIRFADPDEDDKRRHEEEARVDAEEQELAARRLFNEAYLQRMGRPQAFGLS